MHHGQPPRRRRPLTSSTVRDRRRLRPNPLTLEGRTLLANMFEVTNLLDDGSAGSLRYEVQQAEQTLVQVSQI